MSKRGRGRLNGQGSTVSANADTLDAKIAKLEAATEKAERATQQAREVTAELHASIQASKEAGHRMVREVRDEFKRQGVDALVLQRVNAYLDKQEARIQAVYADGLEAIKVRNQVVLQQTAHADKALRILEQWVARLFLLSKSRKFREVARETLGKDIEPNGDLDKFFAPLRAQTETFLEGATQQAFEFTDATTGATVVLHVNPRSPNGS